jgi:hypothetical protein
VGAKIHPSYSRTPIGANSLRALAAEVARRGRPLLTHATIVNLIANTRTSTGLKVRCELDTKRYPDKVKISNVQMAEIRLVPDAFHGNWNYTIRPR